MLNFLVAIVDLERAFYCSNNREHNIFKHPVVKEINFRYACKNLRGRERERINSAVERIMDSKDN